MLFLRGIATLEAAHGPDHPDVAAVLSHFAALLHQEVCMCVCVGRSLCVGGVSIGGLSLLAVST